MRGDLKLMISDEALLHQARHPDPKQAGSTLRRPELFDVRLDPAERRTRYYENETLGHELERQLLHWLDTESEATKEGRAPRPPAGPGG